MQCKKLFFVILVFISTSAMAHSFSRGKFGEFPKWSSQLSHLTMYYRPSNSSDIPDSIVESVFNQSVGQWNDDQYFDLSVGLHVSPINSPLDGRNEIYFDRTSPYFAGGGIVGVTQLVYRSGSGEILEADILLNDTYTFSTNPADEKYLGNVVTHEVGHVFGIGHSEVHNSTMFYMLHQQQHTIAPDDHAAMNTLYPGSGGRGKISGRIIGGANKIGIFAAHVQAISRTKGIVVASTFSEDDGTFSISGLPLEDDYYLYIGPPKYLGALTGYYSSARTNFCEGGMTYRGSFFESCYSDQKGFPHSMRLSYSHPQEDIGSATIHCDLSVPTAIKSNDTVELALDVDKSFTSFAGSFSATQFGVGYKQFVTIDLRDANFTGEHYLDLKMLSQSLYSTGKYRLHLYVGADNDLSQADSIVDPVAIKDTGDKNLELATEFLIDNDFYTIAIEPVTKNFDTAEYFSDFSNFGDKYYLYQFIASVKKKVGASSQFYSGTIFSGEDNNYCPMAKNSYTVVSNSSDFSPQQLVSKEEGTPISCGTISDIDQGPGSGPGGMFIGFLFMMLVALVLRISERAKSYIHNYWL